MTLNRINILLGVLLAITAALAAAMNGDHSRPNVEFMPEMTRSAALDSWETSSVLPHGRTLQAPVAGTIPRGDLPLRYTATKEDATRAGDELQNPYAVDVETSPVRQEPDATADSPPAPDVIGAPPELEVKLNASIQRGAHVYSVFCVPCHGTGGAGDGSVTKLGFPPPPSLTTGKSVQMKDGQLFHVLTYGQGSMSSMAAQLDRSRRWDAVNYIRSLQSAAAAAQPEPPTQAVDAAARPPGGATGEPADGVGEKP